MESVTSWDNLEPKLSEATLTSLNHLNFEKPTPIQYHLIPKFLSRKDVVAQAVTGSGKTLAFLIPIVEFLNEFENVEKDKVFALILTPTSELAYQTYEMFEKFLANFNNKKPIVKIFKEGSCKSSNKVKDVEYLMHNNGNIINQLTNDPESDLASDRIGIVLISTPGSLGRYIDLVDQSNFFIRKLKSLEILIMDEADRLLEMGFETQLGSILRCLPKQRLTGLFSATQTSVVEDLVRTGLRNPVKVSVTVQKDLNVEHQKMDVDEDDSSNENDEETKGQQKNIVIPSRLSNYFTVVSAERKLDYLLEFINLHKQEKILVFFATCCCVDYFYRIMQLLRPKLKLLALHKKVKSKRQQIFRQFRDWESGKGCVMLCTDLMARGVDVPHIDWVVHFDPPKEPTDYVHRCGRTARVEEAGKTLLMLRPSEDSFVHFLSENQQVKISRLLKELEVNMPTKVVGEQMKQFCIKDRLLYEKSIRAFTSYVQFYKKHELRYIFKLRDIDIGQLANAFGLLRLPEMAELKDKDVSKFISTDIDLKDLCYKSKSVKKIREKTLVIKRNRKEQEKLEKEAEKLEQNESVIPKKRMKMSGFNKNNNFNRNQKKDNEENKMQNKKNEDNKNQNFSEEKDKRKMPQKNKAKKGMSDAEKKTDLNLKKFIESNKSVPVKGLKPNPKKTGILSSLSSL